MYHFHIPTLLIQFHTFSCLCVKVLPLIIFVRLQSVKPLAVLSRVGYQYINIEWWQSKCRRENILFCINNINCEKQLKQICRSFLEGNSLQPLLCVYVLFSFSVSHYKPFGARCIYLLCHILLLLLLLLVILVVTSFIVILRKQ